MTAKFFRVMGPFRQSLPEKDGWLRFGFICHRDDNTFVHYTLSFNPYRRTFSANSTGWDWGSPGPPLKQAKRKVRHIIWNVDSPFDFPDVAPLDGNITDILRNMLTDEDVAACTAAALKASRQC